MERWWKQWRNTVLLIVVALVVIGAVYYALKALGLDASAFAAVASALAAIVSLTFAWQASASADQARRALTLAGKPHLGFHMRRRDNGMYLTIDNTAQHPVDRATISWQLRDGTKGAKALGRLGADASVTALDTIRTVGITYESIELSDHPVDGHGIDSVTAEYWGTLGPSGWRAVVEWEYLTTETPMRVISDTEIT